MVCGVDTVSIRVDSDRNWVESHWYTGYDRIRRPIDDRKCVQVNVSDVDHVGVRVDGNCHRRPYGNRGRDCIIGSVNHSELVQGAAVRHVHLVGSRVDGHAKGNPNLNRGHYAIRGAINDRDSVGEAVRHIDPVSVRVDGGPSQAGSYVDGGDDRV